MNIDFASLICPTLAWVIICQDLFTIEHNANALGGNRQFCFAWSKRISSVRIKKRNSATVVVKEPLIEVRGGS